MNINLKGTGIELTEAIKNYVDKRFGNLDKYLNNKSAQIQIEVGRESSHHKHGEVFRAEARISHDGTDFYATKEAEDLYAAIDMVKDEIVHEIQKTRGRQRQLLRRGQRTVKNIIKGFPWFGRM